MTYERRTKLIFLFCTSLFSHLAYSPFVLKKDIFVPWGITILTSRDELLIERRGQQRQLTYSRLLQVPNNRGIHTCMRHVRKNIHFIVGWYRYWVLNTCQPGIDMYWGKRKKCVLISPLQATRALLIATHLYMLGKLMQHCFVLSPCDIYEEIMRVLSVLIEWDDDIDMK